MRKIFETLGAAVLLLIPIISLLAMFEIFTFPGGQRYVGYFVAAYLSVVLVLLTREIVLDALGRRNRR